MSRRLAELAQRRQELQRRAAAQREELGEYVGEIVTRCAGVDRGYARIQGLLRRPAALAGGAALLFFLGPRRVVSLAGRAAFLVSIARRLIRRVL
jgi:hypothetical protein